jgi:hypothetical protein
VVFQPSLLTFFSSGLFLFLFLLRSTGVCYSAHPSISKACPGILPIQSILPQVRKSGCGKYNRDHTPSALDCRATSSSVSTLALMAPGSSCFLNASFGDGNTLSSTRFLGGVLDTGAAMSCVGYRQARALCNLTGVPYELSTGTRRFWRV